VWGTREEVDQVRKALGEFKTDRWLQQGTTYEHFNHYLGVKIYEICLSRTASIAITVNTLNSLEEELPKMLYRVTDVNNQQFSGNRTRYSNFDYDSLSFPGAYNQLCRRYGLPSSKTHFRDKEGHIRPRVRDMMTGTHLTEEEAVLAIERASQSFLNTIIAEVGRD